MSRIGKKPVPLLSGVKVEINKSLVKVSGKLGNLDWSLPAGVSAKVEDNQVVVERESDSSQHKALHGLSRALVANMIEGVANGYKIDLEVYGTGYSCAVKGQDLHLNCGYMGRGVGRPAQFVIPIPAGLKVEVQTPNARGNNEPAKFSVSGCDKQAVGQFAAEVRKLRKPEPYLGKGIRYAGEHITRKAGKAFGSGG
jgi:large subunit ribosomal protein L6